MLKAYTTLLPYIQKYRTNYVLGIISLMLTSAGQLVIPLMTRDAINIISTGDFRLSALYYPLGMMLFMAIMVAIGRLGWRFWLHGAARRIEAELRHSLFTKFTLLGDSFYRSSKIGDLMARATNDLHSIRMASSMGLVAFFDGLFMTIAILIILFQQNTRLTFLIIIPLPIVTALVLGLGKVVGKLFKQVQEGFSTLSQQSQEVFSNIRLIKSFVLESYFVKRFGNANDVYQLRNLQLVQIWGLMFPIVGFLSGLTTVILLYAGGLEVIRGNLSPGEFVATLSYLQMLIWPMLGAGFTVNLLQRGAASLTRINEIMSVENEFPAPVPTAPAPPPTNSLEFREIATAYKTEKVLDNITFTIPAGAFVGIAGPTGSGKTTLIRLLLRLNEPTHGDILMDGKDIREYNPQSLRALFGYVAQDGFLFSDTIANNIAFSLDNGTPDEKQKRVNSAIELSALTKDLAQFPEGQNTQIGERGITVSGGQKQRISVARALVMDPTILIIDDGLSALDAKTEEEVLSNILHLRKGKTTLMVSHRISALRHTDLNLVLEQGRISHIGTHEQLIRTEGFYRDIYLIQQSEAEEAIR